jgi:hypothetical protein
LSKAGNKCLSIAKLQTFAVGIFFKSLIPSTILVKEAKKAAKPLKNQASVGVLNKFQQNIWIKIVQSIS